MSTTPNVPYRLEFSVEVPGTPEQVWQAIATAQGMSSWFAPTELEEREGGALHFTMGPDMGSDGHVTRWDPPRRLVYEEDWAALMGTDPDALSPLTSEFVVEARSGGTCVVHVTSSGFGIGADWEPEFWDSLAPGWLPFFDNLRLYLAHFAGQAATHLEATASHRGDAAAVWSALRGALGLGGGDAGSAGADAEAGGDAGSAGADGTAVSSAGASSVVVGSAVEVRGVVGVVEHAGDLHALVRLTEPMPGMLSAFVFDEGDGQATAGVREYLFSPDAPEYVRREEPAWRAWLQDLSVRTA